MPFNETEKVFTAATADGASSVVEVLNATHDFDISPTTLGVLSPSGKVFVLIKNTGADTCVCKVEWSPNGADWFEGVTTQEEVYADVAGGADTAANTTTVGTTTRTQPDLIASNGSVVAGSASIAQAVAVKGRYCRLVLSGISGTVSVDAYVGGM